MFGADRAVRDQQIRSLSVMVMTSGFGKKKIVLARYVHNDRLLDALDAQALDAQAFAALRASAGARASWQRFGARGRDQPVTSRTGPGRGLTPAIRPHAFALKGTETAPGSGVTIT
jgi:hypothetical protein